MNESGRFTHLPAGDRHTRRDELVAAALTGRRPEQLALLTAARYVPLRPLERLALLSVAPREEDLARLSHYDVERIIARPLRTRRWDPHALRAAAAADAEWLRAAGRSVVWIGERRYPAALRRVYDAPAVLFVRGPIADPAPGTLVRRVAGVGTRRPDRPGIESAERFGAEATHQGVDLVSGLARGIDAAVHRGGLRGAGGHRLIAVLGCGIDAVYPVSNKGLAAAILDGGGTIVSEYPPGTPPLKHHFPARNRIIAGTADATVVFQAPERSGALITAEYALDLGSSVFVHQSGIQWTGCRRLLQDGAAVVATVDEVFEPERLAAPDAARSAAVPPGRGNDPGNDDEQKLALFGGPATAGTLAGLRARSRAPRPREERTGDE